MTRGVNPAYDPWIFLLLAGDVERNPGPVCVVCSRGVREGQIPLRCVVCDVECHRQRVCSGLSRGAQDVGRWHCAVCIAGMMRSVDVGTDVVDSSERGEEPRTGSSSGGGVRAAPRRGNSSGPCAVCGVSVRAGSTPLSCEGCSALCHLQLRCSGLHRSQQEVASWFCGQCREGRRASSTRPPATLAGHVAGEENRRATSQGQREACCNCGTRVPSCRRPLRCS